ncbi:DNA polymerase-4 [Hydrogenoanaerobacterium saccharovorans]|uniref:DNA polymerase IV n=1 Tax=Hydrogenoanaerobacterium saccharovorans TaxID=474960 RepID=A0A1H8AX51_9FIRM|nr:DNA polymerase IV [Hydrogenoanaerobacterium saccharovorans]RPF47697.1 DNA polymerase-4 [Hydrogenoanaerobacterium saccharovorans]SEM75332.1 DNA polymerase-4 [Hydrogenoanaerobacterium saccharovorans]
MDREILHVDLNNFYASVECLHRPELREKPVAVGGDVEQRHGIILAKNYIAKRFDIKTGDAIWQAKQKCPKLVVLPPNFKLYLRFSQLARNIYLDYTDQVEPFGIDECWLDVTGSKIYGTGEQIAEKIRQRVRDEMGVTVSIGVSFNKIFAKLGSDYKKPDAITVITKENYKDIVYPLPASDLLYVGRATANKLHNYGVNTIGSLAHTDPQHLRRWFGKYGDMLWVFANGLDTSPVARYNNLAIIKSIGNSTTTPRDLEDDNDVKMVFYVLAESVAARMREQGFKGQTVSISIRDSELYSFTRQIKITHPTCLASEITQIAMKLFADNYKWYRPIRSIGVSVTDFSHGDESIQLDMFCNQQRREELEVLEGTVDWLRRRYGHFCVQRAVVLQDTALTSFNPKGDHTIHPVSYLR